MKTDVRQNLLAVLHEARALLALADNDFVWSGWDDRTEGLVELDRFIEHLEHGRPFDRLNLSILFAPTGPIQEVSLSSGWGQEFCDVARRFDEAFAAY
ncbi:MAG: hypothetical protein ACO1TE_06865 [Prosthecobacter sp.]